MREKGFEFMLAVEDLSSSLGFLPQTPSACLETGLFQISAIEIHSQTINQNLLRPLLPALGVQMSKVQIADISLALDHL